MTILVAAVLTAADQAIPGGAFVSVEVIESMSAGKTDTTYHVKKTRDGAIISEDIKLLLFYHNRLEGYGLEQYIG